LNLDARDTTPTGPVDHDARQIGRLRDNHRRRWRRFRSSWGHTRIPLKPEDDASQREEESDQAGSSAQIVNGNENVSLVSPFGKIERQKTFAMQLFLRSFFVPLIRTLVTLPVNAMVNVTFTF
jgi:hypothetical protein